MPNQKRVKRFGRADAVARIAGDVKIKEQVSDIYFTFL